MWSVTLASILLLLSVQLNDAFLSPPAVNKGAFNERLGINSEYETKAVRHAYYNQWRDHFDTDDFSTFDQKIYINDQHYNLGPVFIFIGANLEAYDYWLENSFVTQISQEHAGVIYGIEPRFYGESRPTEDLTLDSLRLLTLDQTLADIADIARFLQLELRDNKFILYGYGDGAAVATLAHQTYPELFDGAWAVAAPTYIKFNFFDYFPDFEVTLTKFDGACASIVDDGLTELDALFADGLLTRIHELFGFQNHINLDDSNEISFIFYTITTLLAYDFEFGTQMDLNNLCTALQESSSQGLSAVESIAREIRSLTQNTNPNWDDWIAYLSETDWNTPSVENGERQMWYTKCSERSFFRTSTYFSDPIRTRFLIDVFLNICKEVFDFRSEDVVLANMGSNTKYRLNTNLPNIIFTYGELDPVRTVGQTTDLNALSPAAVIPGFGKAFELLGDLPQEYLTTEMIAVRDRVRSFITSIILS